MMLIMSWLQWRVADPHHAGDSRTSVRVMLVGRPTASLLRMVLLPLGGLPQKTE